MSVDSSDKTKLFFTYYDNENQYYKEKLDISYDSGKIAIVDADSVGTDADGNPVDAAVSFNNNSDVVLLITKDRMSELDSNLASNMMAEYADSACD